MDEQAKLPLPVVLAERVAAQEEIKRHGGMWKPGQSGNPAGRPKGSKNHIVELQRELEIAVRDNLNPKVIRRILERVAEDAIAGDMKAAKLILDKVLSNAQTGGDDAGDKAPRIVFEIKNLTLKHPDAEAHPVIDITPTKEPQQ